MRGIRCEWKNVEIYKILAPKNAFEKCETSMDMTNFFFHFFSVVEQKRTKEEQEAETFVSVCACVCRVRGHEHERV